jgi:hypothetical protein
MKESKITIKQIFGDHYQEFWKNNKEKYPKKMREHINIEVMKMLGCGDISLGFVAFECYTPDEFDKKSGSPIVMCIKCDSDMIIKR